MVSLQGVGIVYATRSGPVPAVEDVQSEFAAGTITSIIGPSGCGKTSLIQAIAGLRPPTTGRILVENAELKGIRPQTAVIFQDYGLLPWKTAQDNVELPLLLQGWRRRKRRAVVGPLMEELGLAQFSRLYPLRLSGGMRQRLAIARALAASPDLLLMDEPFSSLDALTRESLQEMLLAVHARRPMTVIIVTHSIEEAAYLSDTVLVMRGRNPGRVHSAVAAGHPQRNEPRFLEIATRLRSLLAEGGRS